MQILNVHSRDYTTDRSTLGNLVGQLSSEHDQVWPYQVWPAMRFDKGLVVGASGGHGPIRYDVEEYFPNEKLVFRFTGPKGFDGVHYLEITSKDEQTTTLTHTIDMRIHSSALILWPLIYRPLHDALIEDALTRVDMALGNEPRIRPWSVWVKFLRFFASGKAPTQGRLKRAK